MGLIALRLWDKAILCQIIMAISLVPTCVPANDRGLEENAETEVTNGAGSPPNNDTCDDPVCHKMVTTILKQMGNETPCNDFHNYTCGNWTGEKELKPSILKERAVIQLAGLLRKASESTEDWRATNKLIRAFYSCRKNGKDKRALLLSIQNILDGYNVTNQTWPILGHLEQKLARKESVNYMDVLKKTGPRPVFSVSVSMQEGKPILLLKKPSEFYVFDVEETGTTGTSGAEETTDDYSEYYDEMLAGDEKAYRKFIERVIMLLNELFSREEAKNATDDIVWMEKSFSRLAGDAKEKDQIKMNLSQLEKHLGNALPMAEILKKDFEGLDIPISGETEVLVQYIDYFEKAVNLLKCTRKETLFNYIFWTKIRTMAEAVGTRLNKLYEMYRNSTPILHFTEVEKSDEAETARIPRNLSLQCVHQLLHADLMHTAVAYYYISAKFNKTFRDDVLKMVKFVNHSFMDVVQNNTWMSNDAKKKAVMRLKTTTAIIGYPDWMLNETIIDSFYQFIPYVLKAASFVEHYHHMEENYFKQTLLQLKPERYFNRTGEDIPLRSHAYYAPRTNTIVYPAAALVTHYRRPPIPRSANYGTIGTIIAMLFTKLIERYEYRSKETGWYYKNTWDNETRDKFCNRSTCLNNTVECNDTHVYSSHKLENLDEYIGLRVSYQAMTYSTGNYTPPFLLPDKKLNSEGKIFFTFVGSLFCPYRVNEKRVESRADDGHQFPDKLNEMVYTYAEFNKTFNCTLTEGADTCLLMPGSDPGKPAGC